MGMGHLLTVIEVVVGITLPLPLGPMGHPVEGTHHRTIPLATVVVPEVATMLEVMGVVVVEGIITDIETVSMFLLFACIYFPPFLCSVTILFNFCFHLAKVDDLRNFFVRRKLDVTWKGKLSIGMCILCNLLSTCMMN